MARLPKQLRYWARKAGLKPEPYSKRLDYPYWVGHGRHWRVNRYGAFQMSSPNADFDRWANSTAATVALPWNEASFLRQVRDMREYFNDQSN